MVKKKRRGHGMGRITYDGYLSMSFEGIRKPVHVWAAELALGKPLPKDAEVHYINGDKLDNRPGNLVVCPNATYHWLLERRTRALKACGHANWIQCRLCKTYDDPINLYINPW